MTILHVSDLHFHQPWFHWLSNLAPAHDLLVIAGDLLDLNHPASHRRQVEWVSAWIRSHGRPLSICSGNHDLVWDSEHNVFWPARWLSDVSADDVSVDGRTLEIDGLTIYHRAAAGHRPRKAADVWVTHAPPLGTTIGWCDRGRAGANPQLAYEIRRYAPRLVLCGHVHRPLSWIDHFDGAICLNPGRDPASRSPNHILIDLDDACVRRRREERDDDVVADLAGLPRSSRLLGLPATDQTFSSPHHALI